MMGSSVCSSRLSLPPGNISSKVILLFSNQLPFLIDTSALCLLPLTCFLHSHFKPSDRSSHLVKLISPAHIGHERSFAISPSSINQCTNISFSCIRATRLSYSHFLRSQLRPKLPVRDIPHCVARSSFGVSNV